MGGSVRVKPLSVEVLGGGAHDGGADAEDGGLAGGADPEVAMLHEEVDAVLFEGDGEGGFVGDALDDFDVLYVELEAGGGAGVGADFAGDDEAGLQGEVLQRLEDDSGTAALGTMPWMVPEPSRKMGKRSLPEARRL